MLRLHWDSDVSVQVGGALNTRDMTLLMMAGTPGRCQSSLST
jgi:hypothetical protein